MKTKFTIGTALFSGLVFASTTYNVIVDKNSIYTSTSWSEAEPVKTPWVYQEKYDCADWNPLLVDYNQGIEFEQNQTCKIDKTRMVQDREKNNTDGSYKNVGEPYEEKETESTYDTKSSIGTYKGTTCLDILNKGEHHGSGNYSLQNGSTVYCEMTVRGGGYQLKRSREYISDGNLSDGTHINTEDGSNPTNDIVYMKNPVSNYVIRQPYSSNPSGTNNHTEYEIHPEVCDMVDGDYAALTFWVDQPNSVFWGYHNRYWDENSTPYSDKGVAGLIDEQIVDGKTWYKYRYMSPIIATARDLAPYTNIDAETCHSWYVGYGSDPSVDIHMSGFSYQVYTQN